MHLPCHRGAQCNPEPHMTYTFLNVATEDNYKNFFVIEQLFQTKTSNISHIYVYFLWKTTEDMISVSVL